MVLFPVLFSPAITVIPLISISASAILPIFLTLSFTPLVSSLVYTLMPLWITLQQQISQAYGKSGSSQSYPAVRIYYYCTVFIFELERDLYRFILNQLNKLFPCYDFFATYNRFIRLLLCISQLSIIPKKLPYIIQRQCVFSVHLT